MADLQALVISWRGNTMPELRIWQKRIEFAEGPELAMDLPSGVIGSDRVIRNSAEQNITIDRKKLRDVLMQRFEIPEYQRSYRWGEENWDHLWDELSRLLRSDLSHKIDDVFFGAMFLSEKVDSWEVIDGQQRLTTLTIVFQVLNDYLGRIPPESIQEPTIREHRESLRGALKGLVRVDPAGAVLRPRLKLSPLNSPALRLILSDPQQRVQLLQQLPRVHGNQKENAIKGRTAIRLLGLSPAGFPEDWPDKKWALSDTNKLLVECYSHFTTKLGDELLDRTQDERVIAIGNLYGFILNHFILGVFAVRRQRPTLLMAIFQVLNDRGLELAVTDVIRARIVARFREPDSTDDVATEYIGRWNSIVAAFGDNVDGLHDFLVDHFTAMDQHGEVRSTVVEHLLEVFSVQAGDPDALLSARLVTLDSAKDLITELKKSSEHYLDLLGLSEGGLRLTGVGRKQDCEDTLSRLRHLGTKQWRPFLLRCYGELRESGTEDNEKRLVQIMDHVERVSLRQALTGINANKLESLYADALKEFNSTRFDFNAPSFFEARFRHYYPDTVGERLAAAINEKTRWSSGHAKVLLWRLTAKDGQNRVMWQNRLRVEAIHLEHVLPRTPAPGAEDPGVWITSMANSHSGLAAACEAATTTARIERLVEEMAPSFIEDIGNMVLLFGPDNQSVRNGPFSEKLAAYHRTTEFDEVIVNQFFRLAQFTADQQRYVLLSRAARATPETDWQKLSAELQLEAEDAEDLAEAAKAELEEIVDETSVLDELNNWWTIERFSDRRLSILDRALSSLSLGGENLASHISAQKVRDEVKRRADLVALKVSDKETDAG